jgi:hypothetical protein
MYNYGTKRILTDGLDFYIDVINRKSYNFQESPNIINDLIGKRTGNMIKLPYYNGYSLNFYGNDKYIDFGDTLEINNDEELSIDLMVYPFRGTASLVKKISGGVGMELQLSGEKIKFGLYGTSSELSLETTETINLDEWNNILVSYDGSLDVDGVKIYLDDVLMNTNTISNNLSQPISNTASFIVSMDTSGMTFLKIYKSIIEPQENINTTKLRLVEDLVLDGDALEFISNWELAFNDTMGSDRILHVNEFYLMLKGIGTTNGTDFFTGAKEDGARLFPLIPQEDGTANANIYKLDAISGGNINGEYFNFNSGDFTSNGVLGSSGKYFVTGLKLLDFNECFYGIYSRTNLANNLMREIGVEGHSRINSRNGSNLLAYQIKNNSTITVSNSDSRGLIYVGNYGTNGETKSAIRNQSILGTTTQSLISTNNSDIITHACEDGNGNVLSNSYSTRQLCLYFYGIKNLTTQNEIDDFYEVIQTLQINLGRQI